MNILTESINVFTAAFGFIISLALNDALKISFDWALTTNDVDKAKYQTQLFSKWIYALCALIFVVMSLFFLFCLKAKVAPLTIACRWQTSLVVLGVGVGILALIIILSTNFPPK